MTPTPGADTFAHGIAETLANGGPLALSRYDDFPGPVYAISASGHLTYHNKACLAITGRSPQVGVDQWCVAATVLTLDGVAVEFASGPMATALRERRPLRDIEALVERPNGERTAVRSYPTPAIDAQGNVVGVINLLVPIDGTLHRDLLATMQRCRSLAKWIGDRGASASLLAMAAECETQAGVMCPD